MTRLIAPLVFALFPAGGVLAQRGPVAVLDPIRLAQVAPPTNGDPDFETATPKAEVPEGGWVRTRKRSYAELRPIAGGSVRFDADSTARVRALEGGITLTSLRGRIHASGKRVRVEANRTVVDLRDGSAEVVAHEGRLVASVFSGTASVERAGKTWKVRAGERLEIADASGPVVVDGPDSMSAVDQAVGRGDDARAWWTVLDRERNLAVFPGAEAAWGLRTSPLTEYLGQVTAIPVDPRRIGSIPADRERFLRIARESIVPVLERDLNANPDLTLSGYAQRYGDKFVADRFSVGGSDLEFLLRHGIANVGQAFAALDASGASLGIDVRSPHTRSVWRPSSLTMAPNREFRFLDATQRNGGISLGALAVGALLERGSLSDARVRFGGSVFGITADPQAVGGRTEAIVDLPSTRVRWEANAIRLLAGSSSASHLAGDSVIDVERSLGRGRSVWMGRRRFADGPVLSNFLNGQLLANRHTGFGFRTNRQGTATEFGWLADANADAMGNQSGGFASVHMPFRSGRVGARVLGTRGLRPGTGATASIAYPVVPGSVDGYAEIGRGPDGATLSTVGAYFPGLFQSTDTDVFLEVGRHSGVGKGIHLNASRTFQNGTTVNGFITIGRDGLDRSLSGGGVALLQRFGSR